MPFTVSGKKDFKYRCNFEDCGKDRIKNFYRCVECDFDMCGECVALLAKSDNRISKKEILDQSKQIREMASVTKVMTLYTVLKCLKDFKIDKDSMKVQVTE